MEIVANIKPAVVTIQSFDSNRQPVGLGTGFFIDGSQIVTNSHVVKAAEYVGITDLYGNKYTYTFDKVIADLGDLENKEWFVALNWEIRT